MIGLILLGVGLYLIKNSIAPQGSMKVLPYVCIALGSGIFGQGMGNILSHKAIQHNPDIVKQVEIAKKGERNIAISHSAKAKAYDLMTFVFGALVLSFVLMRVDLAAVLLLVFAYLLVQGYAVYYHHKFGKEM